MFSMIHSLPHNVSKARRTCCINSLDSTYQIVVLHSPAPTHLPDQLETGLDKEKMRGTTLHRMDKFLY